MYIARIVLEFYVINTSTGKPYLASYIVSKLDESTVFKKLNDEFAVKGMETKGSNIVMITLLHLVSLL